MDQVKDLNAKLTRIGGSIGQPRNDLYSSVIHKPIEKNDKAPVKGKVKSHVQEAESSAGRATRSTRAKGKDEEEPVESGPGKDIRWEVKETQLSTTAKDG